MLERIFLRRILSPSKWMDDSVGYIMKELMNVLMWIKWTVHLVREEGSSSPPGCGRPESLIEAISMVKKEAVGNLILDGVMT